MSEAIGAGNRVRAYAAACTAIARSRSHVRLSIALVATLACAASSQAVVLPFTGTVNLCQVGNFGTSCPGSGQLDVSWQVSGVAQLDRSTLQIGPAAPSRTRPARVREP